MAPPSGKKLLIELPDHLLHQVIMPHLPFKTLNRWKCLSKEIHSLITTDAQFADDQARSAATSSSGFVHMSPGKFSFFPDQASIGVPDPSLHFLNPSPGVKLVSSTNGLLLLCGRFFGQRSLCVCNPATEETAFVPDVDRDKYIWCEMGLAYDPCKSPNQYAIVDPVMHNVIDGTLYKFDVFRSNTGQWTRSSQSVYVPTIFAAIKAECANGVIHWSCQDYLLWYDTEKDLAGFTALPIIDGKVIEGHKKIGVYGSEITCCHAWEGGIEVWILLNGSNWNRLHAMSWDMMVDSVDFCHGMRLRHKSRSYMFFKRRIVRAAGFDGRFVYITVLLRSRDVTEKLFAWETETGRVEDKGLIRTDDRFRVDVFFSYANSMARVPQL